MENTKKAAGGVEMRTGIQRLCVISPGYPTEKYPSFPFVDQLLCAFAIQGIECTVISPQSITKAITDKNYKRPTQWKREYKNRFIEVYQPRFISFSNLRIHGNSVTDIEFERSIFRQFNSLYKKKNFDAIYGHFWNCGLIAAKLGEKYELPAYVACGESNVDIHEFERNLKFSHQLKGVVCVSSKSLQDCIDLNLCKKEDANVFPNAIDNTLFFMMDKRAIRKKLGYSVDDFIVAFVGSFSERKGSKRLSAALDELSGVKSIFIGNGPESPTCDNRLFTGSLPHRSIPEYLNAADVFVLPTLNEGCCNAIIEAMACGLPVISSNLPFNWDVLDNSNAMLIDPNNVEDIRNAISLLLHDNNRRQRMSEESLFRAKDLTIDKRASNIIRFMESRL